VVYEPALGRILLFWGPGPLGPQTWEWDGRKWTARSPVHSPTQRFYAPMALDTRRGKAVLFGAQPPQSELGMNLGDTWEWDGTDWADTSPATGGPSIGSWRPSGIAYDDARGRVVFAETNGGMSQMWEYDGATWTFVSLAGSSPLLADSGMAFDSQRQQVLLFGGHEPNDVTDLRNETWEWDGTTWNRRVPTASPPGRFFPGVAYDPGRQTVVMTSGIEWTNGTTITDTINDTWEWNGTWTQVNVPLSPSYATNQTMAYDALNENVFDPAGWVLRWESTQPHEVCGLGFDVDGDGLVGCDDPDCWGYCTPLCPPNTTCDPAAPRCGDGVCSTLESCRLCPADCGACPTLCGDFLCDAGETAATCPGDCH
jgi:hypothetical protein